MNRPWGTKFDADKWSWSKGTVTTTTTGQFAAKVSSSDFHSSPNSLSFGDVGGLSGISQSDINTADSQTMTLSFWLKWGGGSQSAGDMNAIEIRIKNGYVVGCFTEIYPSTWTMYSLTLASTSELTILAQVISCQN